MRRYATIFGSLLRVWTFRLNRLVVIVLCLSQAALADKAILLDHDIEALQARVDIIQRAEKEINAEYFSVWNDDESVSLISLLLKASQKGIKVRLIVDSLANTIPRSIYAIIEKYGKDKNGQQKFEVKVYNPISFKITNMTHRDHSKMLVVDGRQLITGGRNIGNKYFGLSKSRNFDDLDIFIEGDAARQAQNNFMEVWNSDLVFKVPLYQFSDPKLAIDGCLTEGDKQHCEFIRRASLKKLEDEKNRLAKLLNDLETVKVGDLIRNKNNRNWFMGRQDSIHAEFISHEANILNGPGNNELSKRFINFLSAAESDIKIVSPYFVLYPELNKIFQDLKRRGVNVTVVTNSLQSTDNLFAQAGYRAQRKQLIKMGIELYEYNGPNTLHAKAFMIDHKIAMVGTFNIDPRSAFLNREVAVQFSDLDDNKLINSLATIIEHFRKRSTLVGKDGIENINPNELQSISPIKRKALKVIHFLLPLIEEQL